MSLTIELTEEQVQALTAQAEAQGLTVERFAQKLVEQAVPPKLAPSDLEEWRREFHAWVQSHDRSTPLLSDEAISRDSIYEDRF